MDPMLLVAAGFFLLCFVVLVPMFREQYAERHEDDREFLREQRPVVWAFVDGVSGPDDGSGRERPPGYCPNCETENGPDFTFCRNCDMRLPAREE